VQRLGLRKGLFGLRIGKRLLFDPGVELAGFVVSDGIGGAAAGKKLGVGQVAEMVRPDPLDVAYEFGWIRYFGGLQLFREFQKVIGLLLPARQRLLELVPERGFLRGAGKRFVNLQGLL
jgi:hypothetical protein